jgi:hypothetical protein
LTYNPPKSIGKNVFFWKSKKKIAFAKFFLTIVIGEIINWFAEVGNNSGCQLVQIRFKKISEISLHLGTEPQYLRL